MAEKQGAHNLILGIITAIAGLLVAVLVPLLTSKGMSAVLTGALAKIEATGNPMLQPALKLVTFFFPFWGALNMVAGAALVVLAWPVAANERWARGVAVGLLAIPSVAGAYFSGPIMFFSQTNMSIFLIVMLIGLIPYFLLLLWDVKGLGKKAGVFFLFLILGVTASWSFSNGHSSLRMFLARPEPFQIPAPLKAFAFGVPALWISVVMLLISLPLLANYARSGWWLALSSSVGILIGNAALYIQHTETTEFLVGIIFAVLSLLALGLPNIGRAWISDQISHSESATDGAPSPATT